MANELDLYSMSATIEARNFKFGTQNWVWYLTKITFRANINGSLG